MATRDLIVLEIDGSWLAAMTVSLQEGRVVASTWCMAQRPERVVPDDAGAVGAWVAETLRANGLSGRHVVAVASRGDVVLKPLTMPRPEHGPEDPDLAEMVRLQMLRQLSVAGEGTSTDFVTLGEETRDDGSQLLHLLAGAMPAERLEWWKRVAQAAGIKLERIGLRCFGIGSLASGLSQRRDGPILAIGAGMGSVDFAVVENGRLQYARSADGGIPAAGESVDTFVERTIVEARRTWASYRASRVTKELESVAVIGDDEAMRRLASQCGEALSCAHETVATPALLSLPREIPATQKGLAASLGGLLLEEVIGVETIDFAHPRRAPDRSAKLRRQLLVGALASVLLCGVGYVGADQHLSTLRTRLAAVRERESTLLIERDAMLLKHAKVSHLEEWSQSKVDWISHLQEVLAAMPEPQDATLNEINGKAALGISYLPKPTGAAYPKGDWRAPAQITFNVSGDMDRRQVVADLRERLLGAAEYEVENKGPDTEARFALELTTNRTRPVSMEPKSTEPAQGDKSGTKSPPKETANNQPAKDEKGGGK